MAIDQQTLQDWVSEAAERLAVPGVAVGVYHDGAEHYAYPRCDEPGEPTTGR